MQKPEKFVLCPGIAWRFFQHDFHCCDIPAFIITNLDSTAGGSARRQ
jgi:hypothetical protein